MTALYQRNPHWPDEAEFCRQVDAAAKLFELDPNLPEIQALKDAYERLSNRRASRLSPTFYLRRLSPYRAVRIRPDGEVCIVEDPFGERLLSIASLIRHHVPHVDTRLGRMVADGGGLHLYELPRGRALATVSCLPIDPRRPADSGNRYAAVCDLIFEFTGVALRWREHVGRTVTITTNRLGGRWLTQIEPPPAPTALPQQPTARSLLPWTAR